MRWTDSLKLLAIAPPRYTASQPSVPKALRRWTHSVSTDGSVTAWLGQALVGDRQAVEHLWNRYFSRLVGLVRQKLRANRRRMADEGITLSAFDGFRRPTEAGRLPDLTDRDSLWRYLVVCIGRPGFHHLRDEGRQKRGGAVILTGPYHRGRLPGTGYRGPCEGCRRLLDCLHGRQPGRAALCRIEGFFVVGIAEGPARVGRSARRKLRLVRSPWEREVDHE